MPPNASVIIFDDSPEILEITGRLLTGDGHTVIGKAMSIDSLDQLLTRLHSEIPVTPVVALIDDNAPWYDGEAPDPKGVGAIAERRIKAVFKYVTTVATTSDDKDDVGYGEYRYRQRAGYGGIGKFVTSLPAKER